MKNIKINKNNKGGSMKNIFNVAKGFKRVVITIGNITIVINWRKNYSFKVVRENNVVMEGKIK